MQNVLPTEPARSFICKTGVSFRHRAPFYFDFEFSCLSNPVVFSAPVVHWKHKGALSEDFHAQLAFTS